MSDRPTPETDAERYDFSEYGPPVLCSYGDWVPVDVAKRLERKRDEAREAAQELLDALSKLVALNAEMTSDDCTYERAYYCYYKGHYDKWKLATEALAKAKEAAK